jgi:hypothetical protein
MDSIHEQVCAAPVTTVRSSRQRTDEVKDVIFPSFTTATTLTSTESLPIAHRAELGVPVFDSAYSEGMRMTPEQAVAYAL